MTTSKDRVLHLQQLVRELGAIADDDLRSAIAALPDESQSFLRRVARSGADSPIDLGALRKNAIAGKLKGTLEQVVAVISDVCLNDCVEKLGDNADLPSEDDLNAVLPELVTAHGRSVTRLMLSSAVAGEAPAASTIQRLLKSAPYLATPSA